MGEVPDFVLRPYGLEDAAPLHDAVRSSMLSLSKWMPWCHAGYSLADAQQWVQDGMVHWENGTEFPMGIFDADGRVLGTVGVNRIDRVTATANLGYWIRESEQGKGIATRAARLMVQKAFTEFGIATLEIAILPDNVASQRVAEKLQARKLGIVPDRILHHSGLRDAIVYVLNP